MTMNSIMLAVDSSSVRQPLQLEHLQNLLQGLLAEGICRITALNNFVYGEAYTELGPFCCCSCLLGMHNNKVILFQT